MARLSTTLVVTVAVLGAVGVLGRSESKQVRPPAVQKGPELGERREGAVHIGCAGRAQPPVESANVNLIADDGVSYQGAGACATPQNEPAIAVNPGDPQNLVAAANDFRICCHAGGEQAATGWAYYSRDGGATWANVLVPGLTSETGGTGLFARFDMAEDPALAFAPNGTAYYGAIVFATRSNASGIAVSSSSDGGASWSRPQLVQYTNKPAFFNDKVWIAAGDDGRIAVTWTRFRAAHAAAKSFVEGVISRDGGATWAERVRLSDDAHVRSWGAQPVWAGDGALYTVFETARTVDDRRNAISVSTYRAGRPVVQREVGRVFDGLNCFATNGDLRQTLSDEAFRVSSLPAVSIDPETQTLAIVWADGERGCKQGRFSGLTDAQVKLVFVHGTHASQPRMVTRGADKALPAVVARGGNVLVGYYTRSFAPASCVHRDKPVCLDYAYSTSTDGFRVEHRLSDASSNPFEQFDGTFIGDYTGLAIGADGVAHAVWTDSRRGDQNIFGAAFTPWAESS